MINLRMIGIASAILLLLPVVVSAWPDEGSEGEDATVEYVANAAFEVTDVALANVPREKIYDPDSFKAKEQLVEGHTVFVTIDVTYRFNQTNGTIDIWGDVHCSYDVGLEGPTRDLQIGPYRVPITIPTGIDHARAECTVAGNTVVMPDPTQGLPLAQPTPTGREFAYRTPRGDRGVATEYTYEAVRETPDGRWETRTLYAWVAPIHEPWLDLEGRPKNFYCPIPEDRLTQMGLKNFKVYHERDAPGWS